MKKLIIGLSMILCAANAWCQDDLIENESVDTDIENYLPQVNEEGTFVHFSNNELLLNNNSLVVIYNAKGSVIYFSESTNEIDCSGWQEGIYTAKINNTTVFRFSR